jgi:hypothetical protein
LTDISASGSVTLSGGTANGVTYLNGSKVLTSGSALVFDGTNFSTTGTSKSNANLFNYNTNYWNVDGHLSNYSATNGVYLNGNIAGWLTLNADGTQSNKIQLYGASSGTANIMAFTTASSERMRLDASGNLLLGATSLANANYAMEIRRDTGSAGLALHTAGSGGRIGYLTNTRSGAFDIGASTSAGGTLSFSTSASGTDTLTERARITSGGFLGVATTSPQAPIHAVATTTLGTDSSYAIIAGDSSSTNRRLLLGYTGSGNGYGVIQSVLTGTAWTDTLINPNGGNVLVGTTDNSLGGRFIVYESSGDVSNFYSLDASMTGQIIAIRADRNTTNNSFYAIGYYNTGAAAYKFRVADSGNVTNTNNSYGAISDVKLKENIIDASPKLADLMQVKVRNYNLIGDTTKQLGVVAQELETVFPAMVDESPDIDGDGNDLGTTTKQVKYSVFVPMLVKALQEAVAEINSLKARLDAANL